MEFVAKLVSVIAMLLGSPDHGGGNGPSMSTTCGMPWIEFATVISAITRRRSEGTHHETSTRYS
jgi:hypothetical protein